MVIYQAKEAAYEGLACANPLGKPMISAVVFDAFGTLVDLRSKRHPFRQLLREGIVDGRRASPDDVRVLMSNPWSLKDAADQLGMRVSPTRLQALQDDLDSEVASIIPYEDGIEAVALLRAQGVRVGICSNLCEPYGAAVLHAFPDLDGYAFSYQVGAVKPDALIYQSICRALAVTPGHLFGDKNEQIAMVGDSLKCDQDGPRGVGMLGFHLDRSGKGAVRDLVQFAQLVIASRRNHGS
jgi:HAD superfamily hydrolase (TIGR01549 family)